MKISLDWLRQYVDISTPPDELAEMLTMSGFEVEAMIDPFAHLADIIIGKISTIEPHPDADSLTCCKVEIGNKTLSIVCGAPNVKVGMSAPLALPGTTLPCGTHVAVSRIRGQLSEGMLCSEAELGLGADASGILPLKDPVSPGTPLVKALALADTIFEIGLTPNRPDCLSVIGIAREVAALTGAKLIIPERRIKEGIRDIFETSSVAIENSGMCPRYSARMLNGVTIRQSPPWLRKRLVSIGLKPINNIVDTTNYVMMETGQPLHAFDLSRLAENRIVVRTCRAASEKSFTTLDGKTRSLTDDTLMICDGRRPVAVAGVMGGANSEIEETTTDVLIESAHFDPISIRKTAKHLGISTDASYRFERGVDPESTIFALNRAAALMVETAGGEIAAGIIDEYPGRTPIAAIRLDAARTNRHLGTDLSSNEIRRHLESVEFKVTTIEDKTMDVVRPSFRMDVSRPEDLMEEVARLSGYNHIKTTFPTMTAKTRNPPRGVKLKENIRELMTSFGFSETIHYSFTGKNSERLEFREADIRQRELAILNPLSETQSHMRTSLVGSLLEACQKNIFRQERDLRFFELGKTFYSNGPEELPEETYFLAAAWTGARKPQSWHEKTVPCDFYDIKGVMETFFAELNVTQVAFTQTSFDNCNYTRPGHSATIRAGGKELGVVGEIRPSVLKRFDINQKIFVFEININELMPLVPKTITFTPIPRFPHTSRDLTLIIDDQVEAARVVREIEKLNIAIIEDILIFDVYRGKPIEKGKKSISIRITYQSLEQTLEDAPINALHQEITEKLITVFGASLPS